MSDPALAFGTLLPEDILDALEGAGLRCDGRLQALNSFENRVYLVGLEDRPGIVAKFYRPGRWSDEQILEEHAFSTELQQAEVPVVAPLRFDDGSTLAHAQPREGGHGSGHGSGPDGTHRDLHRFAIFPRQGGRIPELDNVHEGAEQRHRIGQFIARIHHVGARRPFASRPSIDATTHGDDAIASIESAEVLPLEIAHDWSDVARACADAAREGMLRWSRNAADHDTRSEAPPTIRLHGDCHVGNLLWTDGPHFVDMDDCRQGPAIQDLWMLADISGDEPQGSHRALDELLRGYREIRPMPQADLSLVEVLRTLRMLHYCAWLVVRREDPAFAAAFPWYGSARYWEEQVQGLRAQLAAMELSSSSACG